MPFTLPPITRRRFLAGSAAVGSSLLVGRTLLGQDPPPPVMVDADRVALLSDPHIGANRSDVGRGVNMFENLAKVVGEVGALDPKPTQVMINGDCAWVDGQAGDYALVLESLRPLREAGMPIQMTLGNHDHRERFWQAIEASSGQPQAGQPQSSEPQSSEAQADPPQAVEAPPDEAPPAVARPVQSRPVQSRHVSIVAMERANWFLLDSLDQTNVTPGALGEAQLQWLARVLDEQASKPALVMVHHNVDFSARPSALTDTAALLDVLRPRRHVKALIYGHSHTWRNEERDGIHLINLPATSYVFGQGQPSGWVDVRLKDEGATFQLKSVDPAHPSHEQTLDLTWRGAEQASLRRRPGSLAKSMA
jgi:3',5'-cyclic AMP phosphodiesterase CpdA